MQASGNPMDIPADVLVWCRSVLGPVEVVADLSRSHPDRVSGVWRLRTASGYCYAKIHRSREFWEAEVYAYEHWASAFGQRAPTPIAVRDEDPLAIVITGLPGRGRKEMQLSVEQERAAWCTAGRALAALHSSAVGQYFGPCQRNGSPASGFTRDAVQYISADLTEQLDRGICKGFVSESGAEVVRRACGLAAAFEGEPPVPCHRDYIPANWLVTDDGAWAGIVDLEFARWDVRVTDFARYPDWEWMTRPDLLESLFDGYGQPLTARQEKQLLVSRVQYALGATVWGSENAYYGFAKEGHEALEHLSRIF